MKKQVSLPVAVFLCIVTAATGFLIAVNASPSLKYGPGARAASERLAVLDEIIESHYLGEADSDELADGAAYGYIAALGDKYSAYLSVEEQEASVSESEGEGVGIGITATLHPDTGNLYIVDVFAGSPAESAGIKPGDQIELIGNDAVSGMTYSEAFGRLRGSAGTDVTIGLLRGGDRFDATITRAEYTTQSVFARMIGSVCCIKITTFNSSSVPQFAEAITFALNSGASGIIFDLRNNGGGTVTSVGDMLDLILPEGDVMTVEYADGTREVLEKSDANEIDLPMAVLVNGKTASAAELFTASIRDFDKGRIYGGTTYGKGVMQSTYALKDGSAVRITVAKFYPHSGVSFNETGIEPDVKLLPDEKERLYYFLYGDENDTVLCAALKDFGVALG